jgi:spermidine synthase
MLASGFAGLGYQIVWTQQSALWLGHEAAAVLAVVAAFFGGLSLGGLCLGARIERSSEPRRWYVGCELLIGGWGLALVAIGPPASHVVLTLSGVEPTPARQWAVAFVSCFALFLPATAAMGATLPAMERLNAALRSERRSLGRLYAANTAGAVLGVVLTAFWLIQTLGLRASSLVYVALNLLCAGIAQVVFPSQLEPRPARRVEPGRARAVLTRLALTGLLGVGYEVVVVRVLSQVSEDTVYTFALLLAVYLVGTAAGAAAYERWFSARKSDALGDALFIAQAAAVLVGTASLWWAPELRRFTAEALGGSAVAAITAEALLALFAFGPPTLLMGAVFSRLSRRASAAGVSFGRALGVNTLAAALAPALFGVFAVPQWGPKVALLALAAAYLVLSSPRAFRQSTWRLAAAGVVIVGVVSPPLRFVEVPEGGHVVSYREGPVAAVSVVEDARGVSRLRIDNRQQEGSSASLRFDARQAWLPLLLHPQPHRALFLGLGTGVTATAAAADRSLKVDAVELLPDVIAASSHFAADDARARLHTLAADARRYVRVSPHKYDVIVSDNFHPARSGSGSLYTVEHFDAVQQRLTPQGVFCQWLPLHQLDLETLRSIVASFVRVYPQSWAILANNSLETPTLGLVTRRDQLRFDLGNLRERLRDLVLAEPVSALGLEDEYAVLGSAIAGPQALSRFARSARVNTDDQPVVAYHAPFITYASTSTPAQRLLALLGQLWLSPDELLSPASAGDGERLAAYWAARDRFIRTGRDVRPSAHVEEMLAQVHEPLLQVLRISPDFRPAYDPLLGMASALARSNVAAAQALLAELSRVQPARAEATQRLAALAADASMGKNAPR